MYTNTEELVRETLRPHEKPAAFYSDGTDSVGAESDVVAVVASVAANVSTVVGAVVSGGVVSVACSEVSVVSVSSGTARGFTSS